MADLTFGALAPFICEQVSVPDHLIGACSHWQRDADAITRLVVRGILSEGEAHRARTRLVGTISRALASTEEPDA